jgi:hypothetical protein
VKNQIVSFWQGFDDFSAGIAGSEVVYFVHFETRLLFCKENPFET